MSTASDHLKGLYYPSIHFRSESWIKTAALYWDKIGRIVPFNYPLEDSDAVRQLIEETDLIQDLPPNPKDIENTSRIFQSVLKKHGRLLKNRYSLTSDEIQYPRHQLDRFTNISGRLSRKELEAHVHITSIASTAKMSPQLTQNLISKDLAQYLEIEDGFNSLGFVEMHPRLALTYMEALAEQMATTRNMAPVTDTPIHHYALSEYTIERLTDALLSNSVPESASVSTYPTEETIKLCLANIVIKYIIPRDPESIPTKKIIQVRNKYREELTNFQLYLNDFISELRYLQDIEDYATLNMYLSIEYQKKIRPQINNLRKCLRSNSIDTTTGMLNVQVVRPALQTSIENMIEIPSDLDPTTTSVIKGIRTAGAVIFRMIPILRKHNKASEELLKNSPISYLLHLQDNLTRRNFFKQKK